MRNATTFVLVVLVFVLSGILTAAAVLLALDEGGQQYKQVKLHQLEDLDRDFVRAGSAAGAPNMIVFLGDSLNVGPKGFIHPASWVSTRLGEIIAEQTDTQDRASIVTLQGTGLTVYSYYFMCDRIIELDPEEVVLEFNLFWLSEHWHRTLDRTVLAAWLPLTWWREAVTLPLHITSLTTDRWIFYRTLFKLGLSDTWYRVQREQARLPEAYWNLAARIQELVESPKGLGMRQIHSQLRSTGQVDNRNRATPLSARALFGTAVDGIEGDQFALLVLNAVLRRLENADIPALVYVPPHNVEHLDELGLLKREGLDRTLSQIGDVVRRRGARFVDLHDQFPDAAFRDHLDHYVEAPDWESSRLIAEQLAPHVLDNYLGRQETGR